MKLSIALIALLGVVALSGCANTWAGAGQDTQNVGHEMEKSAGVNR